MRMPTIVCVTVACLTIIINAAESTTEKADFEPVLRSYLKDRSHEFDQIPAGRKSVLHELAQFVKGQTGKHQTARLTFICTHNSRRSHLSQIWAAAAARYYGIKPVEAYSGGTESTAFNPRAIAALKRAGVMISMAEDGKNPRYEARFAQHEKPILAYSKAYHEAPNPQSDFCAIMTCSQADQSCPIIKGCSLRLALPYEDPKVADDKPEEKATYDERSRQISREMMYLFSQVEN